MDTGGGMTDHTSVFGERLKAAVEAKQGMDLNADELRMMFDALRTEMASNEALRMMANRIGQALQAAGWQIHVNPADGLVDGIEPMLPGADSGVVN